MSSVIVADELTVSYNDGAVVAVDRLSLSVNDGEVVGVLGGNGAGKTSTLRTFGGIFPPSSGSLTVAGFDMSRVGDAEDARRVVGYCPDIGGLIRQATVREHLGLALGLRGLSGFWPRAVDLVEKFGLLEVMDRETGGFSHGMSRRLSVVLAVLTAERVLILDEPFDGVDPLGVDATREVLLEAKAAGLAIVVSTHLLSLLGEVSDRIVVMNGGHVVSEARRDGFEEVLGGGRYFDLLSGSRGLAAG